MDDNYVTIKTSIIIENINNYNDNEDKWMKNPLLNKDTKCWMLWTAGDKW